VQNLKFFKKVGVLGFMTDYSLCLAVVLDVEHELWCFQGEALTKVSRGGPELYNHCNGPALGASLKGNYALLSISQYLSRWGSGSALSCNSSCLNRPFCLSTLAQLMFEPWENSVFSLSVLNRFWPNGQLPSFMGLHWRDMGPFVLSKTWHAHEQQQPIADSLPQQPPLANSVSRQSFTNSPMFDSPVPKQNSIDRWLGLSGRAIWEDETCAEVESSRLPCAKSFGTTMQSVAFAGKIDVSTNVSLGGWAQVCHFLPQHNDDAFSVSHNSSLICSKTAWYKNLQGLSLFTSVLYGEHSWVLQDYC
jgi:hypothetical protein